MTKITPEEFRRRAQEAMQDAAKARAINDMASAEFWMEIARQCEFDAQNAEDANPGARIPSSGEVAPAAVRNPDAGYYFHDTGTGRWVPTSQSDALARKQAGEQIIEPKES